MDDLHTIRNERVASSDRESVEPRTLVQGLKPPAGFQTDLSSRCFKNQQHVSDRMVEHLGTSEGVCGGTIGPPASGFSRARFADNSLSGFDEVSNKPLALAGLKLRCVEKIYFAIAIAFHFRVLKEIWTRCFFISNATLYYSSTCQERCQ